MNPLAYLILLALGVFLSALWDAAWLRYLRPLLAKSYGWPDVRADERIPAVAWVGALLVISLIFIVLPVVGVSVGY